MDSIDKNLISYPEMVALLEFINKHEDVIKGDKLQNALKPKEFKINS